MSMTDALNADRGALDACACTGARDSDDDTVLGCEAAMPCLTSIFDGPVADASAAATTWNS